jgi:outer membrane protein OmpA-like peptidoglycan-associated protein/tetratricopeptide (TPR) repeat protein
MNRFQTTAILLLFPLLSFAQYAEEELQTKLKNSSEQELVTYNSELLQEGYLYQAGLFADRLLEIDPASSNYNYRRGFIYLEMSRDFIKALPFLEKAAVNVDKNFDMYSANEKSAPTDAIYHLARCYHLSENIDKAEEYYKKFIAASNQKSEFVFFANLNLQQCAVARREMPIPHTVRLQNLGSTINTAQPEFSPVISLDGSALYFTSRRKWANGASDKGIDPRINQYPEDIYVSYMDFDQTWTDPVRLEFCDSIQNEATLAVSSDERRVYLYQDTRGNGDIFYSDFSTNRFQRVEHYESKGVNMDSWETHCTVTPDGMNMYFVSDRKGGFGGRDIYRVTKLANGDWSSPQNLGATINGPFDEESPFIAVDNKTLYFSSNGPKSMGGFDVFVTVRSETNTWSDPINLGYPLNSTGDDIFYTTTVDGMTGYLTSFRKDGLGEKDIYEIKNDYLGVKNIAVLKGKINTVGGKPIPEDISITLRCTNCGDPFDRKVFPRTRDGVFLSSLEPCREYEMIFSYEGGKKEFYKETFSTNCTKEYDEIYREVLLDVETQEFIKPYILGGIVKDKKTKEVLSGVKVTIVDKNNGDQILNDLTIADGSFLTGPLKDKKKDDKITIGIRLEKEGYVTMTYDYTLKFADQYRIDLTTLINPEMTKIEVGTDIGAVVAIGPIYFDYNKWNIREDAKKELNKIVKVMKENPNIKVELGSHTDARGSDESNAMLSDKRAKSSAEYIISQGVDASRIVGKGYGESRLIVSDEQIATLKTVEAKEAGHQKNRRTEFLVVK